MTPRNADNVGLDVDNDGSDSDLDFVEVGEQARLLSSPVLSQAGQMLLHTETSTIVSSCSHTPGADSTHRRAVEGDSSSAAASQTDAVEETCTDSFLAAGDTAAGDTAAAAAAATAANEGRTVGPASLNGIAAAAATSHSVAIKANRYTRPSDLLDTPTSPVGHDIRLRLQLDDLSHEGVRTFSAKLFRGKHLVHADAIERALQAVRLHLFPHSRPAFHNDHGTLRIGRDKTTLTVEREVRSITLVVREMDGIACTQGIVIDDAHKEIHLSANYVESLVERWTAEVREQEKRQEQQTKAAELRAQTSTEVPKATATISPTVKTQPTRLPMTLTATGVSVAVAREAATNLAPLPVPRNPKRRNGRKHRVRVAKKVEYELRGVLVHEMVHTLQFDGGGTAPGGLIEGIADWIRLKAGFAPIHWRHDVLAKRWDAGYEKTAFFLDFASRYTGSRFLVPHLNQALACHTWLVEDEEAKRYLRKVREGGREVDDADESEEEEEKGKVEGDCSDDRLADDEGRGKEPFTLFECLTGYSIGHIWRMYKRSAKVSKGGSGGGGDRPPLGH